MTSKELAGLDYWEFRKLIATVIPRMTVLKHKEEQVNAVREKGRKSGYHQFNLKESEWVKQERLLSNDEINSFVEVSVRAAACPMPLNIDTFDSTVCNFACAYCYANAFRASLYTAFFDNSKTLGLRHCNPDKYRTELDKMMGLRGKNPHDVKGDIQKAIAMDVPMRFGIRYEDFLPAERKMGISLNLLDYLADNEYPLMINTKSDLVGEEKYVEALARNEAGAAVHITMISNNEDFLHRLEPGAPTFAKRLQGAKNLCDAGVRVVARIEPFLVFSNDRRDEVERYMEQIWEAGIRNITFDTYSYTANNPGIKDSFIKAGIDYDRMFLLGCDSQALGSLLLGKFMEEFRKRGFSCSTFDMGNAPDNDQSVCCEVGDWFKGGFNYGCTVMAARYIQEKQGLSVSWASFVEYVNQNGGFLSESLKLDVHELWNGGGNLAYSHFWSQGIVPAGADQDGVIWKYEKQDDHRLEILSSVL